MLSDRSLIAGALVALSVAFLARSSFASSAAPSGRRWTTEEHDAMGRRLAELGVSAIMLPDFRLAPTPQALANSVFASDGAKGAAELAVQLVTHVFSFSDRAGELYRAAGNVWRRDVELERAVAAK